MSDHPLNLLHPSLGLAFTSEFVDVSAGITELKGRGLIKCNKNAELPDRLDNAYDLGGFPLSEDEE